MLAGAAALALLLAAAVPAHAWAQAPNPKFVASPDASAKAGCQIWTLKTLSNPTVTYVGSNVTKKSDGNYYIKKGKKKATIEIAFPDAGVVSGGARVDYAVTLVWALDNAPESAAGLIFNPDTLQIRYGFHKDDDGGKTGGGGGQCTVTIRAYNTGTLAEEKDKWFLMSWGDLDGASNSPAEAVELVSGYDTSAQYAGEAISKASGHQKTTGEASEGKRLNYKTQGGHPLYYASHNCNNMNDSRVAYRAKSGHQCIVYGQYCATRLGLAKSVSYATVRYHVNGGAVSSSLSGTYSLASSIVKVIAKAAELTTTVSVADTYKNLPDICSSQGVYRTGYHVASAAEYYYRPGNATANYYFNSANTAASQSNPVTSKRLNNGTEISSDATFTLYVNWKANSYTVKYNGNGATEGSTPNSSHVYNTAKTLNKNGFRKTGYAFQGWATSAARANAGTVDYKDQQSVKNLTSADGGVVNLYAVWKPNQYSIRYEGIDDVHKAGQGYPDKATYGSAFTVSIPERDGYRFEGWKITGMDANPHQIGAVVTSASTYGLTKERAYKNLHASSGTVTFTATWTPVTTFVLHVDDGESVWRTVSVDNFGQSIDVPDSATEAARKPNCHRHDGSQGLDAWYEDAGYAEKFNAKPLPVGEVHLYGRNWSCITLAHGAQSSPDVIYTGASSGIAGDIATASGTGAYLEIPYAESRSLPEPVSQRVTYDGGFGFPSTLRAVAGWFRTRALTGAPATKWVSSGDATLYKKWDASITDGALSGRG